MLLDPSVKTKIQDFFKIIKSLNNESAKTSQFFVLITELFTGHSVTKEATQGVEKTIYVNFKDKVRLRRMDLFRGNVIFEFENSLAKTGKHAEVQLCEYAAGVWGSTGKSNKPLVCVATDGIEWIQYHPFVPEKVRKGRLDTDPILPSDIELKKTRELKLTKDTVFDFWLFLNSVLFQEGVKRPSLDNIRWEFGVQSSAFSGALISLRAALNKNKNIPQVKVLLNTWSYYTILTHGSLPENPNELFLKQTYISIISKFITWGYLSKGKSRGSHESLVKNILTGEIFRSYSIENFGEQDFYSWVLDEKVFFDLKLDLMRILAQFLDYDLGGLEEDIFRGLYEELILVEERKNLGEFYTPEWLCDKIVSESIQKEDLKKILDPSCGSGGFLRAAIKKVKSTRKDSKTLLTYILNSIVGIDINPLAVSVAKATYLISLGDLIKKASRPIHIPIYLANSLSPPQQDHQLDLGGKAFYNFPFGFCHEAKFPDALVETVDVFEKCVTSCQKIAEAHAKKGEETPERLKRYLKRQIDIFDDLEDPNYNLDCLWDFTFKLSRLIKKGEDSIWSYLIRNAYRPAILSKTFDILIGNPPWLTYKGIEEKEYQKKIKDLYTSDYELAHNKSELTPQLEISTLFSIHSLHYFGSKNSNLIFINPRSIFTGKQHHNFRFQNFKGLFKTKKITDLFGVRDLFRTSACIIYAEKKEKSRGSALSCDLEILTGRIPNRNVSYKDALKFLEVKNDKISVKFLGDDSALVIGDSDQAPEKTIKSHYYKLFREGGTIVPNRCFVVAPIEAEPTALEGDTLYHVQTNPDAKAKKPYIDINISGQIEGRFIFQLITAENVLPFRLKGFETAVFPLGLDDGKIKMLEPDDLFDLGEREAGEWFSTAWQLWEDLKSKKSNLNLIERLDYAHGITSQNLKKKYSCLFTAHGVTCAVKIKRTLLPKFLVNNKFYFYQSNQEDEIDYLVAILNSNVINDKTKLFKTSGLGKDRDSHRRPLALPIPKFLKTNSLHQSIACLGKSCEKESSHILISRDKQYKHQRVEIKKGLSSTYREIDNLIEQLFDA
jgi:methylase of polypeptide subunit release factors